MGNFYDTGCSDIFKKEKAKNPKEKEEAKENKQETKPKAPKWLLY